eukprot:5460654-Prymnesium_polylepis.1
MNSEQKSYAVDNPTLYTIRSAIEGNHTGNASPSRDPDGRKLRLSAPGQFARKLSAGGEVALATLGDRATGALAGLQESFAAVSSVRPSGCSGPRAACSRGAGLWGNCARSERDDYRNWRHKTNMGECLAAEAAALSGGRWFTRSDWGVAVRARRAVCRAAARGGARIADASGTRARADAKTVAAAARGAVG